LAEVEERRSHLKAATSSLFDYCLRRLGLSESAAFHRITAARLARKLPVIFELLEARSIHLSALRVLREATGATEARMTQAQLAAARRSVAAQKLEPLARLAICFGSPTVRRRRTSGSFHARVATCAVASEWRLSVGLLARFVTGVRVRRLTRLAPRCGAYRLSSKLDGTVTSSRARLPKGVQHWRIRAAVARPQKWLDSLTRSHINLQI
jgi:hypothetical protein